MENQNLEILIVDDDIDTARLMIHIMEISGFRAKSANSGKQAISMLEQNSFDIMLLDVIMPHVDGIEVCQQIKNNPKTASTFVVLMTALSDNETKKAIKEAGADEILIKPFCIDQFIEIVSNLKKKPEIHQNFDTNISTYRILSTQ